MTPAISATNTLVRSLDCPAPFACQEFRCSASIRLIAVTDHTQDITLTTKEGDTVTLSLDQSAVAVYGRDGRFSQVRQYAGEQAGDQMVYQYLSGDTREWFGMQSSRELTLSIEGDLSREETQDIHQALQRIHQLMGQTFGAQSASISRVSSLAGLDTLDGIEVDIQESRLILATRSTRETALTYGKHGQTASAPAPSTPERPGWQQAADVAVGMVKRTEIASQHFARPLEKLFHHWSGKMRPHHLGLEPMVRMMAHSVFEQLRIMPQDGVQNEDSPIGERYRGGPQGKTGRF